MRNIFIVLALLFSSITLSAQKIVEGNLDFLNQSNQISVHFNLTEAIYAGMSFEEFAKYKDEGGKWDFQSDIEEVRKEQLMNFLQCAEKKLPNYTFNAKGEGNIKLEVKLVKVDKPGREMVLNYIFSTIRTEKVLAVIEQKGKGGHWGTFCNLLGDAYKETTPCFLSFLKKELKRISKQTK